MKVFSLYNALFLLTSPQILKYYNIGMRKTLLLLCALPCLSITAQESNSYVVNFDRNQTYTHASRRFNGVTLNGSSDGTQQVAVTQPNQVYNDLTSQCFTAKAGETLTASFNFAGNWMHGFVYLDRNGDGVFSAELGDNCSIPEGSDIMAFSYAENPLDTGKGYNSRGEQVSNSNVLNPPSFTLPADLPNGLYRMRFKVDWAGIDPGGRMTSSNSILQNGGGIIDVMINVHGDTCPVVSTSQGGALTLSDGSALNGAKVPFGKDLTLRVSSNEGFVFDGVSITSGYQLDGPAVSAVGNPMHFTQTIPAYLLGQDNFTLPAKYVNGEMDIKGIFVEGVSTDNDGVDYPLAFAENTQGAFTTFPLTSMKYTLAGKTKTLALNTDEKQVYQKIFNPRVAAKVGGELSLTLQGALDGKDAYLYLDLNQDGQFTSTLQADGRPSLSGELVAYTHYQGKNSLGENAQTAPVASELTLPTFTLPQGLVPGVYRARLKLDVNNISPSGTAATEGADDILTNGGVVVDFLINVTANSHHLKLRTLDGSLHASLGNALPRYIEPYTALKVYPQPAVTGFVAESFTIRHGHNLNEPQYVHGNPQWSEYIVQAKAQTLPADSIDGDVHITALFHTTESAVYRPVWSDEFDGENGTEPTSDKWMRCQRQGATWNRWLSDRPEVIYLEDGDLVARAIPNPDTTEDPVPMITGGVKSMGKFGFTYGKVECRALSNPWVGNFPAIWMMPEDQSAGWPDCGEIDIWEVIDTDERSYHTIHSNWTYDLGNKNNPTSSFNLAVPLDRYHTYGLEWDETSLTWFVDGKKVGTYSKSTQANVLNQGQWPFDKHFHLILNQSVGNGAWAANADVSHTYETRFDWVRVYQKNGQVNTDGVVGIDRPTSAQTTVTPGRGCVKVSTSAPTCVQVYDLCGRCVHQTCVDGQAQITLLPGIYLVEGERVLVR